MERDIDAEATGLAKSPQAAFEKHQELRRGDAEVAAALLGRSEVVEMRRPTYDTTRHLAVDVESLGRQRLLSQGQPILRGTAITHTYSSVWDDDHLLERVEVDDGIVPFPGGKRPH